MAISVYLLSFFKKLASSLLLDAVFVVAGVECYLLSLFCVILSISYKSFRLYLRVCVPLGMPPLSPVDPLLPFLAWRDRGLTIPELLAEYKLKFYVLNFYDAAKLI